MCICTVSWSLGNEFKTSVTADDLPVRHLHILPRKILHSGTFEMNCKFIHDPCVFCYFVLGLQNGRMCNWRKILGKKHLAELSSETSSDLLSVGFGEWSELVVNWWLIEQTKKMQRLMERWLFLCWGAHWVNSRRHHHTLSGFMSTAASFSIISQVHNPHESASNQQMTATNETTGARDVTIVYLITARWTSNIPTPTIYYSC